tara:strand:- start:391 stop:1023 length:633 start_codon:yes stop_codon:yes gene_type:complete
MTKNSKSLINENVIRRWGKLANMPALTENFIDSITEDELEDEMAGAADAFGGEEAEPEMDAAEEPEADAETSEAVEAIVSAVVAAISAETGVEIEVEGEAGEEAAMDDMDAEMEVSGEMEAEMEEEDPAVAMRDPYNRKDITERGGKKGDEGAGKKKGDKDYSGKGMRKGDENEDDGIDETIDLDVIDDENLTEAVLKRVVERLLRSRRK